MPSVPARPIRAELYSLDRMVQFGPELADQHHVWAGRRAGRPVLPRLMDNRRTLLRAARLFAADVRAGLPVSPTAEWLVENFGLVEEQLREIEEDLPPGFYLELPKLMDGEMAGYPRVYALAWSYVEHTDSRFDLDGLTRFVTAYQTRQPLTIGELWAIAISLRLVLVENLRRLADAIVMRREERERADGLADVLLDPARAGEVKRRLGSLENAPIAAAFSVQLLARLRDHDPATTPGLLWLERRLAGQDSTVEHAVREEHFHLAAMQGPVRDGITSMRALSAVDWSEFVEGVSLLQGELEAHSALTIPDFATRDRYRHAVEDLARGSTWTELAVGKLVAEKVRAGRMSPGHPTKEAGYYLVSVGRAEVEREIAYRPPWSQRLLRGLRSVRTSAYLGGIAACTLATMAAAWWVADRLHASFWEQAVLGLLGLLPASEFAAGVVDRTVTRLVGPQRLPKLALREGVPDELRTLVVIPALLSNEAEAVELVARLEVHFLANDDPNLRFAVVSDWCDSQEESLPADAASLSVAVQAISALNSRYALQSGGPRFFLLHRRRQWNASESRWMGWERKRGKLHELNRLLRGSGTTSFLDAAPELAALNIRYVITLDSDTRLPNGSALRLVGAIAHPLNRATHDRGSGCVTSGYGILQPRITPTLPAAGKGTPGQRVHSGPGGMDPYAFAVSDLYQDLFSEGSYTGKGIYDVDAFERALSGRVPENTLLSHDLFEGLHARAGLVSDVELFEDFPAHYQVSAARQHRWARGDWQLLPYIFRRGPISAIGRWKMADNLRRTLLAPATLAALLAALLLPDGLPWVWTIFLLGMLVIPAVLPPARELLRMRRNLAWRGFLRGVVGDLGLGLVRVALSVILLPETAWQMLDAAFRTLYRLVVSRRHLLEWVTAAQVQQGARLELEHFQRAMARSVVLVVLALLIVCHAAPHALVLAAVFATLWIGAPVVARWASSPPLLPVATQLDAERARLLRLTARRTWRYFESFVTSVDHHLPPDNFQIDPIPTVAHRTSPTNIGLYLLSAVSAHDMGWIGTLSFIQRMEATLTTVEALERYRGHLFNWYDTTTLAPLAPRYVSTVDSGNLAGHLIALQQACLDLSRYVPSTERGLGGIADALALVRDTSAVAGDDRRHGSVRRVHLDAAMADLAGRLRTGPAEGVDWDGLLLSAESLVDTAQALAQEHGGEAYAEAHAWARAVRLVIAEHLADHSFVAAGAFGGGAVDAAPAERLRQLAERSERLANGMEWQSLYDTEKRLFAIGFNVQENRFDRGAYDLLASECRLASFMAIAKGDVPATHWFRLGRRLTSIGAGSALISWSGSMFEYLMPELVMAVPQGSLLDQTARLVVARQIRYGHDRGVPWGVSEAAYNARDIQLTYQYSNFGVSGLGLKRGLADDLVIAPYATALAAMFDPVAAADNLVALAAVGASGAYGFCESVDYTRSRLPEGSACAVVKAWFAHHQGMSVVALCNVVGGFPMRRRFHASPMVQAAELLLHERTPRNVAVARTLGDEAAMHLHIREVVPPVLRQFSSPHDALPATHRLSNGRYSVAFTAAGGGQSSWKGLAVTRWREDETLDATGSFVYLRDTVTGRVWSAAHQPTGAEADSYSVQFHEHRIEVVRRDGSLTTRLDVVISPEDDAEVRQVTVVNHGARTRSLELTSYAEVVLAPHAADVAHPAFSNLFVQTEFEPGVGALLATRRPRSAGDARIWAAHISAVHGCAPQGVQFESDRARFIGRGRTARTAAAVLDGGVLSNTVGSVLDPVFALRRSIVVGPGQTVRVTFATLVGPTRERVVAQCDAYRDPGIFDRTLGQAWTHAQVQLRHLGITLDEAQLYQRLASRVLVVGSAMRASQAVLRRHHLGQTALWRFGISGDKPILLGHIYQIDDREAVRQLVHAHCYWRMKGLAVDLVLLNEHRHTYGSDLQAEFEGLVRASHVGGLQNGVHVIRGEQLTSDERDLLLTASRVVVDARDGSLSEQMVRHLRQRPAPAPRLATAPVRSPMDVLPPRLALDYFNGIGGFTADGRDYVVVLGARQWTPLPWVNVLANPSFGCVVSESGSGFAWAENSHENQLTPWSNDPVSDPPGDALYVRDDDTGETWTPTPLPIREDTPYVVCHGQGFTRFTHDGHGINLELVQFVPPDLPVRVSRLRLRNTTKRERHLTVAAYVEWVLGASRASAAPFVVTSLDRETGAMFAKNVWKQEFSGRVAFLDMGGSQQLASGDRGDWLGRNGSLAAPAGLSRHHGGAGPVGAGMDPCGVLMAPLVLAPGASRDVVVVLGQAADEVEARRLVLSLRASDPEALLAEAVAAWDEILEVVQVRTPDPSMDLLLNRWLIYQTISCRMWARAGFYQAGGAYGFRDQLQDGMALTLARPDLTRAHLLRAAARQFPEGDVQHWWHPPSGKGVRTRFSDDRIWLPFTLSHYIDATADAAVLDEEVPYLDAPALAADEQESYQEPAVSGEVSSLYEHGARALDVSLPVGRHGLPLMGGGDWNDGMNRVGQNGEGESVWLAWFLISTLNSWIPIAEARGDTSRAAAWRAYSLAVRSATEASAWDGAWYRRAYMDDGTPLGSAAGVECRIDSIAQSWAVLSKAAPADRAIRAMAALDEHLIRRADGIVLLLTPPFDQTPLDPGYIKGYLPGIRENGGQYTHAAIWAVMAFAELGEGNKAAELFAMVNPVNRASSRAGVQRYKAEPYVTAADVYGAGSQVGRGGWTWYTGSSSWMYRAGLEWLLGIRVRGDLLHIEPCIPAGWSGFEVNLRIRGSRYQIVVVNPAGVQRGVAAVEVDGLPTVSATHAIALSSDGGAHRVLVTLGKPAA